MTNIRLSLPAPVHKDVKSSSVVVSLSDMMVLVSSALPKTILSGKISPSSDENDGGQLFPNEQYDISANMSLMDEIMAAGVEARDMRSSTFRVQFTMEGLTVEAKPAIPLHDAAECETIVLPTKMSVLLCIDVTAPPTAHTRKAMGIAAHISAHMQQLQLNVDFDVIVGVISCLMHHAGCFQQTIQDLYSTENVEEQLAVPKQSVEEAGGGTLDRVLKSQISRSFESGIVVTLAGVHIDELDLRLWRQECNLKSYGSAATTGAVTISHPVLLLARFRLHRLQVGVEAAKGLHDAASGASRVTLKAGLSSLRFDLCDPNVILDSENPRDTEEGLDLASKHLCYMTEILSLGSVEESHEYSYTNEETNNCIRLDYDDLSKVATASAEINAPSALQLKLDAIEQGIAQVIQCLFIPTGIHHAPAKVGIFPEGSLGSFIAALVNISANASHGEVGEESKSTMDGEPEMNSFMNSIHVAALRLCAKKMSLVVPIVTSNETAKLQLNYNLQLNDAACAIGYFFNNDSNDIGNWVNRKSGTDADWSEAFMNCASGLHVSLKSTQSVSQIAKAEGDSDSILLVRPFSIEGAYHPDTAQMKLGEVELSFGEAQIVNTIANTGKALGENVYRIVLDGASFHSSLSQAPEKGVSELDKTQAVPAEIAAREATSSISTVQTLLASLEIAASSLGKADPNLNDKVRHHDKLERAKVLIFLLERQRAAALSLVSARVCGWIRMGATNVNGQRIVSSTNLWRYWAVLRKNLLIISDRPGAAKLIDIIPLRDVTLHSITGQNKRTEVARGFALRDGRGYERIFSCATG